METPRKLPNGRWQARYTAPDGTRKSAGTYRLKSEAQGAIAKAIADISRGVWTNEDVGKILFRDYAATVLEARRGELTPSSLRNFETHIRLRLNPAFGDMQMKNIRATSVKAWWGKMPATPTRRNAYMVLSSIFKHAIDDEIVVKSPCRVKGAGKDASKPRPELTMKDFYALYDLADEQFKVFLLVMVGSAMRTGEITGLNRKHFDAKTGTVTIEQQFKVEPGGMVLAEGTKTGAGRQITLSPDVTEALATYLKKNPAIGDVPIFQNSFGRRLSRRWVWDKWDALRGAAGLEWAHVHDLRHTSLTEYLRAGANEKDTMARAGHTDPRSMMRYQHTNLQRDAAISAAMGERMRRTGAIV
ncbi:Phage integrase, N-terminal SAM-like domain [Agromyces sp. CF514]|uniref:tyrosine-type recombinase/integrase n=1 Tax=Agromyces sp. CF514 TaxID=1881031 RepID=UPI0008E31880|nr:site-specific integrase [Agromyces sp. CF514]SFR79610.1 Phage integrase, N-terminal SAM-like domain [Agromyces sp. CF514]